MTKTSTLKTKTITVKTKTMKVKKKTTRAISETSSVGILTHIGNIGDSVTALSNITSSLEDLGKDMGKSSLRSLSFNRHKML